MPDLLDSYLFSYLSGSVAEWSKAMVLSTSHVGGVCSNPLPLSCVGFTIVQFYVLKFIPQKIHTTATGLVVGTVSKHPSDC